MPPGAGGVYTAPTMTRRRLPDPRRSLPCRWALLLVGLSLAGAPRAGAADVPVGEGEPFVQYWSPRDFHGATDSWGITQDRRGVLYVGNRGFVLEYDGSTWRHLPMKDASEVLALDYEAGTDTVFVGTQDDLGYLKMGPDGARTYVSLFDQLPADARDVGSFYGVYATPQGVFFVGSARVLRWRDGRFKTWNLAPTSFLQNQWSGGQLYVSSPELGLRRLEGEEFVPVADDPVFHRDQIRALLPEPDGSLLVAMGHEGLFTLRDGAVRPLESECNGFLKEKGIHAMLRLRDGSFAIASPLGGLVILDPAHRFRNRVEKPGELRGNVINALFEDTEGGLWMGLYSGVSRAEIDSPLSVFRAGADDDMSSVYSAVHWGGTMIVANDTAIYRLAPADPRAAVGTRLERLVGDVRAAVGMRTVENGVLLLSRGKLALLDADAKLVPVAEEITDVADLLVSRVRPDCTYVSDEGGHVSRLRLDETTRRWMNEGVVAGVGAAGESKLAESASGDVWLGTIEHGLFRLQPDPAGPAKVTSFFDRPGPLRGEALVSTFDGEGPPVFQTQKALYRFDAAAQAIVPLTEFGARFSDGSVSTREAVSYDARSLWLVFKNVDGPPEEVFAGRVIARGPGRAPVFQPVPGKIAEVIGDVNLFRPVEQPPARLNSVLIVGTTGNGIVRLDVPRWEAQMAAGDGLSRRWCGGRSPRVGRARAASRPSCGSRWITRRTRRTSSMPPGRWPSGRPRVSRRGWWASARRASGRRGPSGAAWII